jgi:hypothetical protein
MMAWLILLSLIVAEIVALRWWLKKEYYPVIFNSWAPLIYSAVFVGDIVLGWVVARLLVPDAAGGFELMLFIGAFVFVVTLLYTLFLMWIVRQDLGEPK